MKVKPSIGRIVVYTTKKGNQRAAIVVNNPQVTQADTMFVNLRVFTLADQDNDDPELTQQLQSSVGPLLIATGAAFVGSVQESCSGDSEPGRWHWPPRQ